MPAAATTQILGFIMSKSTQSYAKFWRNIHFLKPIPHSPLQIDVFNGPPCDSLLTKCICWSGNQFRCHLLVLLWAIFVTINFVFVNVFVFELVSVSWWKPIERAFTGLISSGKLGMSKFGEFNGFALEPTTKHWHQSCEMSSSQSK